VSVRRVAAISDIHGNLPALEAVLAEVVEAEPDLVVFCGDVALGFLEAETIDRLRQLPLEARFVLGNCDRDMAAAGRPDPERAAFLAGFERTVAVEVDGLGPVLFCHGTPSSENEILTEASPVEAFAAALDGVDASVVVGGHTHMQFVRGVGARVFVNAGSVGRPYGESGAFWALLGPSIVLRRTVYSLDEAAGRLSGTEWAEHAAAPNTPRARAEAVAVFERMAGRDMVSP
jgi:putative phosphoesterase